jgi:transposase
VTQNKIFAEKKAPQKSSSLETLILASLSDQNLRPEHHRRLEIMLRANMGQSQTEICTALGCSPDTARYWMAIAQTDRAYEYVHAIGRPKTVNEEYLARLKELVSHSPQDYGYPFQRWTAQWLQKHLAKEFGIEVSDRHINRLLKQMGLSTRNSQQKAVQETPWQKQSRITIADLQPTSLNKFD